MEIPESKRSLSCPPICNSLQFLPDPTTLTVVQLREIVYDDKCSMETPDYRVGGYMPIQINQRLGPNNEYRIIRKLGWGSYSTVWLSKEEKRFDSYYAIKVVKSSRSCSASARQEIRFSEHIRTRNTDNNCGRNRLLLFSTHFIEGTVRGRHLCLVSEVMGPSLLDIISKRKSNYGGYDEQSTKLIIKQVIEGLRFLHQECRIIHGDLKLANILISVKDSYAPMMEAYVKQFEKLNIDLPKSYVTALEWQRPTQLSLTVSEEFNVEMNPFRDDYCLRKPTKRDRNSLFMNPNINIKITDLGCAVLETDIHPKVIQTRSIRALEVTLEAAYSFPIDMWSVGCITFELLTGSFLFKPIGMVCPTQIHLQWIWEILDGIPKRVALSGLRSFEFFNPDGTLKSVEEPFKRVRIHDQLLALNHSLTSERGLHCENFIMSMLRADPSTRPTAAAALIDTWLVN